MKTCAACLESLPLNDFSKTQLRKWKKMARCSPCVTSKTTVNKKGLYYSSFSFIEGRTRPNSVAKQLTGYSSAGSSEEVEPPTRKRKRSEYQQPFNKQQKLEKLSLSPQKVRRIRQLGDGNCLYRSLVYCVKDRLNITHNKLRITLAQWVVKNQKLEINGAEIAKWIRWENHCDVFSYCNRQKRPSQEWGGQIELCAFSHVYNVEINVFQFNTIEKVYKRVTNFPTRSKTKSTLKTVNLLYVNRNHYDALTIL